MKLTKIDTWNKKAVFIFENAENKTVNFIYKGIYTGKKVICNRCGKPITISWSNCQIIIKGKHTKKEKKKMENEIKNYLDNITNCQKAICDDCKKTTKGERDNEKFHHSSNNNHYPGHVIINGDC